MINISFFINESHIFKYMIVMNELICKLIKNFIKIKILLNKKRTY